MLHASVTRWAGERWEPIQIMDLDPKYRVTHQVVLKVIDVKANVAF